MLDNTAYNNINTYGLYISGSDISDNILGVISNRNYIDYKWNILYNNPSSTYWYHSYYHGTTKAQIDVSTFSFLIIKESSLQNVPE